MRKIAPYALAALALPFIHGLAAAQSRTPAADFDGRDASYDLIAGSTLRRGDRLTDTLLVTVWQRTTVKGAGKCTAGACPITFNGQDMYARRSRLVLTSGDGSNGSAGAGGSGAGGSNGYPPGTRRLQRGDTGDDVKKLQDALVRDGAKIEADGNFGRGTRTAVEDFQRRRGLQADGVAGRETLRALGLLS